MNPFKPKTTVPPPSPETAAVQKSEEALVEVRRAASKAAEAVAEAEADTARARAALQIVEEAERRRPAEERQAKAFERAGEIDGAITTALEWLAGVLRERYALTQEAYSVGKLLGSSRQLFDPDVKPHGITIRPGRADIAVSWKN
jgi:multidrug efflux pump subunit AcrA (membrane-fusion protein)